MSDSDDVRFAFWYGNDRTSPDDSTIERQMITSFYHYRQDELVRAYSTYGFRTSLARSPLDSISSRVLATVEAASSSKQDDTERSKKLVIE